MKTLRSVLFWTHLACGVIGGLAILVMSATGAVLAFKPQIQNYIERDVRTVPVPAGQARLGVQALLERVRAERPDAQPASVTQNAAPSASAAVALGRDGTIYVDPYTGRVLGEGSQATTAFFRSVENWHRWLAMSGDNRAMARSFNDAANFAFLFLAISGIYIWWPRKWLPQHLNAILWFRRTRTSRARDFNWHNAIGFWCAPIIIILSGTGVVMSYTWANNLLYQMAGSPIPVRGGGPGGAGGPAGAGPQAEGRGRGGNPGGVQEGGGRGQRAAAGQVAGRDNQGAPAERPGVAGGVEGAGGGAGGGQNRRRAAVELPANLDAMWARAEQQLPEWSVIIMRLPGRAGAPVTFAIGDSREWNSFGRSTLTVNAATTEVVKWEPYSGNSLGQRLRQWVRFSHTGELGRWPGQAIAAIACLGGVVLVWTGLALAFRRLVGWSLWKRLRARTPSTTAVSGSAESLS